MLIEDYLQEWLEKTKGMADYINIDLREHRFRSFLLKFPTYYDTMYLLDFIHY